MIKRRSRIKEWVGVGQGFRSETENCCGAPVSTICPPPHCSREPAQTGCFKSVTQLKCLMLICICASLCHITAYLSPHMFSHKASLQQMIDSIFVLFCYVAWPRSFSVIRGMIVYGSSAAMNISKLNIDTSGLWISLLMASDTLA